MTEDKDQGEDNQAEKAMPTGQGKNPIIEDEPKVPKGKFWPVVLRSAKMAGVKGAAFHTLLALEHLAEFYEPMVITRKATLILNSGLSDSGLYRGLKELARLGICTPPESQKAMTPTGLKLNPGNARTHYTIKPYTPPIPEGEDYTDYARMLWDAASQYYRIREPYQYAVYLFQTEFHRAGALDIEGNSFCIIVSVPMDMWSTEHKKIRRNLWKIANLASEYSGKEITIDIEPVQCEEFLARVKAEEDHLY